MFFKTLACYRSNTQQLTYSLYCDRIHVIAFMNTKAHTARNRMMHMHAPAASDRPETIRHPWDRDGAGSPSVVL